MVVNIVGITYGTGIYNPVPSSFMASSAIINLYNMQGGISQPYASFGGMNVTWTQGGLSTLVGTNGQFTFTANVTATLQLPPDMPSYPIGLDNVFNNYITNAVVVEMVTLTGNFYILGN